MMRWIGPLAAAGSAHLEEIYGVQVGRDLSKKIFHHAFGDGNMALAVTPWKPVKSRSGR
jgi:hypothetical protein